MKDKIVRILLRRYQKIGYKGGIAKVVFDDEFEDIAEEIVKLFSIPDVVEPKGTLCECFDDNWTYAENGLDTYCTKCNPKK